MCTGTKSLVFYYDADGEADYMVYRSASTQSGTKYYFVKNLQGDITKLMTESGGIYASYTYDVFGRVISVTDRNGNGITSATNIANLNPLRYRGYVYDTDTGLYYLQSRYYDPVTGRFVNADVYCDTQSGTPLSTNMYAYCENNAVNKYDPSGMDAWWLQDVDGVYSLGHTSLLIQEAPGHWWYFYWGDKRIKLVYIGTCSLTSLNKKLNSMKDNRGEIIYDGTYERIIKIKGSFKNSLLYIFYNLMRTSSPFGNDKCLILRKNTNYDLLFRNCVQVSIEALLRGDFGKRDRYDREMLKLLSTQFVPNISYRFFSLYNSGANIYGGSYAYATISDSYMRYMKKFARKIVFAPGNPYYLSQIVTREIIRMGY